MAYILQYNELPSILAELLSTNNIPYFTKFKKYTVFRYEIIVNAGNTVSFAFNSTFSVQSYKYVLSNSTKALFSWHYDTILSIAWYIIHFYHPILTVVLVTIENNSIFNIFKNFVLHNQRVSTRTFYSVFIELNCISFNLNLISGSDKYS